MSIISALSTVNTFAADPPAAADGSDKPSQSLAQFHTELEARKPELTAELSSPNPDQVQKAIDAIDEWAKDAVASRRADIFELLVETKHYDDAEDRAVKYMLKAPANNWSLEHLQKLRVKSFLLQGKNKEALSAAKLYYNICRFAETKDAISLVSICLTAAHPEDRIIAKAIQGAVGCLGVHNATGRRGGQIAG